MIFLTRIQTTVQNSIQRKKIISLLTSAYTSHSYAIINECLSDNTDDMGPRYSKYDDRFINQAYTWNEMKESDNDGVMNMWQGSYSAISAANHALQAIEELPEPLSVKMKEAKGEALLCRAYHHFILVNEFCQNYNVNTSAKDLGIPYMTTVEAGLNPHYDRGTVAEVYSKMEKDIEEALPLVGDTHYKQPKYHLTSRLPMPLQSVSIYFMRNGIKLWNVQIFVLVQHRNPCCVIGTRWRHMV